MIIAYSQIRDIEDQEEAIALAGVKINNNNND
jgi:hypothetical protein